MGINLRACCGRTGYGVVGLNIFKELYKREPLILWNIGQPQAYSIQDNANIAESIQKQDTPEPYWPSLTIWHEFDQYLQPFADKKTALVFFEKNVLPKRTINHLKLLDIVYTASDWSTQILQNHGIKSETIPMGVDTNIFRPAPTTIRPAYRFFTVGKIEKRKGHFILHEMFNKAFTQNDNVELIINWQNPFMTPEEHQQMEKMYKDTPLGNKISFVYTQTQEQLAKMISNCDCGLFPTAAEGFGLNILEAIACNKPVITTNYSAMPDYCTSDGCFRISPDGMTKAYDGRWFHGEAEWADLGPLYQEAFIDRMRKCYYNNLSVNNNYQDVLKKYNWSNCVDQILLSLQSL